MKKQTKILLVNISIVLIIIIIILSLNDAGNTKQDHVYRVVNVQICGTDQYNNSKIKANDSKNIAVCGTFITNYNNDFFATLYKDKNNGKEDKLSTVNVSSNNGGDFRIQFDEFTTPGNYHVVFYNGRVIFGDYYFEIIE